MAILVTPGQLTKRAELYYQLSATTKAGMGLIDALDMLSRTQSVRFFRKPLLLLLHQLKQGSAFSDALRTLGSWMPQFDIALLEAGEKSGRLDACFQLLSNYYTERAQLARTMIANMIYPLFLIHFFLVVRPEPLKILILEGNVGKFLSLIGPYVIIIDGLILLLLIIGQGKHGEFWRSILETITRPIPILGTARRHLALARLAIALEALVNAGVTIIEAWGLAAAASGSPALRREVSGWKYDLMGGKTPGEAVRASHRFPELFSNLYATGEKTGKIDEALNRLHVLYQESASRKLKALAQWTPRIIYIIILFFLAGYVVSFWTGYYNNIFNTVDKAFGQ